jgi:hypothetical protein
MVKIPIIAGMLGACLLAQVFPQLTLAQPYPERYDAMAVTALEPVPDSAPASPEVVASAMAEVRSLMFAGGLGPVPDFIQAPEVLRVREVYQMAEERLLGLYLKTDLISPEDGAMLIRERIVLFLPEDCLVQEVLVHELLHAMHARLKHLNPQFRQIMPEVFVSLLMGPERPDFPSCPEEN